MTEILQPTQYDVWELIFVYCLPDDEYIQPYAKTSPLLLCRICRSWRTLALSMNKLWTSLSIKVSRRGCIPRADLVPVWLRRAGRHPLRLSLTLDRRPGIHGYANADLALRSILPFFRQWERAIINLGPFLDPSPIHQLPATDKSLLRSLDLYLPKYLPETLDMLSALSPELRKLGLRADLPEAYIPDLKVPFAHLTFLTISDSLFTMDNTLDVLHQCRSLVYFSYTALFGEFMYERSWRTSVVLQQLQVLNLAGTSSHMGLFFHGLTLPSLNNFAYSGPYPFPMQSFTALLHRSACSLHAFGLSSSSTEQDILDCLQVCPDLSNLRLSATDGRYVMDSALEALTVGPQGPALCPKLQELELSVGTLRASDGLLGQMLESRFKANPSFRASVAVSARNGYDVWALAQLKEQSYNLSVLPDALPGDPQHVQDI